MARTTARPKPFIAKSAKGREGEQEQSQNLERGRTGLGEKAPLVNSKKRGEWVEMQFMARAAQHGLTVSRPWGDSARYDFVVEHQGRLSRVQVKSTSFVVRTQKGEKGYRCNVVARQFHRATKRVTWRSYTPQDAEFFAIYVLPEDLWYVIPMSEGRKFSMMLYPYMRGNKAFPYLEAWERMKKTVSGF